MGYDRMPWGKFRGRLLTEVPLGYLRWVLANCHDADLDLLRAVRRVLRGAEEEISGASPWSRPRPPANWSALLRQVRRELALEFHPDRGGSTQAMQAINACFDRLEELRLVG